MNVLRLIHVLLGLVLLVPLLAAPGTLVFPFVVTKVVAFRALVAMIGALFLVAAARQHGVRVRPTWILGAVLAYLASLALSTVCGEDPRRSVLDTSERMLGLLTSSYYVVLFIVAAAALRNEREWRRMLFGIVLVGATAAVIAILQKVNGELLANQDDPRVGSTLGSPAYLGGFAGTGALIALHLFVSARAFVARLTAAAGGALAVVAVLLSESRGGMLALALGLFVFAAGAFVAAGRGSRVRRLLGIALLAGATAGAASMVLLLGLEGRILRIEEALDQERADLVARFGAERDVPLDALAAAVRSGGENRTRLATELERFRGETGYALGPVTEAALGRVTDRHLAAADPGREIRRDRALENRLDRLRRVESIAYRIPGVRRFGRVAVTRKTAETRVLKWTIALRAFQERPLIGVGPNNYFYAYNRFLEPDAGRHAWDEPWSDDAHNVILNTLAEQGVVGLLAYLAMILGPIVVVVRAGRAARALAVFVVAATAQRLANDCLVFQDPSSLIVSFLLLAYVDRSTTSPSEGSSGFQVGTGRGVVALALAAGLIATVDVPALLCNRALHHATRLLRTGDVDAAREAFHRATGDSSPHRDENLISFAFELVAATERYGARPGDPIDPFVALNRDVFHALGQNHALHPNDVRNAYLRGKLAVHRARSSRSADGLAEVERELARARAAAPRHPALAIVLFDVRVILRRDTDEIVPLLELLLAWRPREGGLWSRLVDLHVAANDPEGALDAIARSKSSGAVLTAAQIERFEAIQSRFAQEE